MTWSWSIPVSIAPGSALRIPPLVAARLRVVIPTFRDWNAARVTIDSLLACRPAPAEIVLVSDNNSRSAPAWTCRYPIDLVATGENRGPAFARNVGVALQTERSIDWLLFTDTGCERDSGFLRVLSKHSHAQPRSCVAIAAPVRGVVVSPTATPINHYMTEEGILQPPMQGGRPQAIVTANAAVNLAAFKAVGGFDTSFRFAAAEDLDLGLRLLRLGGVSWAPDAVVWHRFRESMRDFRKRFQRYGTGNAHLEARWRLSGMRPAPFRSSDPRLQQFADAQVIAMQRGYDRYRSASKYPPDAGEISA
ncbi:MAG: glycosyltransferase [Planctomycetes bacterium]|nr:glycosyltransferase [Planctomycetota bacterium]